ncbi:hypothetical protein K474DRAFT_1655341 [Panus rudis PR-1116 ss-1]|nr:hypothetical protein K474DRAFT_1655341 [Panus rudis PR-1116 ss-1]
MDDSEESPTSPIDPPLRTRKSTEQTRRSHKSHKDRDRSSIVSSSKELAKLIVRQESEVKELRDTMYTLADRLKDETQRADDAEKKILEVVMKFKEANDGRLAALQEVNRLREELRLYKMQLESARKEMKKAQETVDMLEAQRHDAEEAAARARTTARKLKEEKVVFLAREEGRQQGIREGIAQGRALGFEEGRKAGFPSTRRAPARDYVDDPISAPTSPPRAQSQSSTSTSTPSPPRVFPPNVFQGSPPEDIHINSPGTSHSIHLGEAPIRPVTLHNVSDSPGRMPADYPPDGWIPTVDPDQRIRLPPPHELAPAPPTPSPPASVALLKPLQDENEQPALMIPPPFQNDTPEPEPPRRPRHRRRNSNESQSTTMSQFEILGPPPSASARIVERPNVLSAIVEEKERSSSLSSPPNIGNSPYHNTSSPNPSFAMPSQTPQVNHAGLTPQASRENIYVRPHSQSSEGPPSAQMHSSHLSPPSREQSRSRSPSDAGYNIAVEPPSRPNSNQSAPREPQTPQPNLLSAEDAAMPGSMNEAMPDDSQPVPGTAPLSELGLPIVIPPEADLPPGFMPMGPPTPAGSTMTAAQVPLPQSTVTGVGVPLPPSGVTGLGVPLPPSTAPSMSRLNAGSTPYAFGSDVPVPGGYASTDPVVIPLPSSTVLGHSQLQSGRYSRSALHKDTSSSDDDVSSDLSGSLDTLTTPPQKYKKTPGPTYATAPTPPDVVYPLPVPPTPKSTLSARTSVRAAKVPLPPSSVGSPRSTYTRLSRKVGSAVGSSRG